MALEASMLDPRILTLLWSLVLVKAPVVLGQIVLQLVTTPGLDLTRNIRFLELFAGKKIVTRCMREGGVAAVSYEILDHEVLEDFLSGIGLVHCFIMVLKLMPGAGSLAGLVCSTWTNMNRATSERKKYKPHGNGARPSVRAGNKMCSRMALVLILLEALCAWATLEQPVGSLLQYHARIQAILGVYTIYRHGFRMWDFGGASAKPTWLYSNRAWVSGIDKYKVQRMEADKKLDLVTKGVNEIGKKTYTGTKWLKTSQAYPRPFGEAMYNLYMEHSAELHREAEAHEARAAEMARAGDTQALLQLLRTDFSHDRRGWHDAELDEVFSCPRSLRNGHAV